MRHLVLLLDELRALDVGLVTLGEGLDTTTPAGRVAFGIFASVAEFGRERMRELPLLDWTARGRKVSDSGAL
jgi:DNA invertase Pin-like site-specific DNA recombinase